ncbi:hypothetical protein FSW04_18665 [Baekduia soli]|uniref:Type II secretion system protein GspF domain-containing protein n=1 Tax=Baekduia soli TaxID=496014 RepID=A0A5B8U8F2_9ACTN|nr:hypothetical protein FSW04_18665 [Baekduia soli]
MATYVFKAMDLTGARASGEVEAESKQVVADQLKQRGLIVLDIAGKHGSKQLELGFLNRIKSQDLTVLTRQLATMVSSGMTILRALYVLEAQTENKKLAETLVAVRKDVEAGLPLSDSLERHPKVFNGLFVAMTRAGETGGSWTSRWSGSRPSSSPPTHCGVRSAPRWPIRSWSWGSPSASSSPWWCSSSPSSSASSSSSAATCRPSRSSPSRCRIS